MPRCEVFELTKGIKEGLTNFKLCFDGLLFGNLNVSNEACCGKLTTSVIPKNLLGSPLKQKTGLRQTPRSSGGFKFKDELGLKLTTIPKLGAPTVPRLDTPLRPPKVPKVPTERIPPFFGAGFFGGARFDSFSGGTRGRKGKVFTAFGISKNINVGNLPTFSRRGKTSKVFGALDKEDKLFTDLVLGKTGKAKKSKSKKSKGKKRRKK